ncbi:hypothetical protein AAFC00_003034 [Neodothiora populina]
MTTGIPTIQIKSAGADVPPPVYTATITPDSAVVSSTDIPADDPYDFLTTFDTVFLIDDSGSMAGRYWRETKDALETIIPVCVQHDADGIDIYFLNAKDSPYHRNVHSSATVREIFSSVKPRGSTPTGQRLDSILRPYLEKCARNINAVKPMNIIVVTDGVPTDDVESALVSAAKKLDKLDAPPWQVGVQFFQVGRDENARAHLKQLDDELSEIAGGEIRDMVDTVPFRSAEGATLSADGILKVVLGAVNRRLDRRRSTDLHR